jgi:streptomycin 6-kinase
MSDEPWFLKWRLAPDGEPIVTRNSRLIPVRRDGEPLMLKIALNAEERRGAELMVYYAGDGAVGVVAHEDEALLLERSGAPRLVEMSQGGRDDEASRIICGVVGRLHARRENPAPSGLVPLPIWFRDLDAAAAQQDGMFGEGARVASDLLSRATNPIPLHGDIHHGNILFDDTRGWLAIDPKGLLGDRYFDYANIFCNPDLITATAPGRLLRQAGVVARAAGLEPHRLMRWIFAYAILSASWSILDGDNPELALRVAEIARRHVT